METRTKILLGCSGCLGLLGGVALAISAAVGLTAVSLNATDIALSDIDDTYTGRVSDLPGDLSPLGVAVFGRAVEEHCRPSKNPLAVIFHQIYYNTVTDYDLRIWVEPGPGHSGAHYALYQSSHTAVLRQEMAGHGAWVISCDFGPDEMRAMLRDYVK